MRRHSRLLTQPSGKTTIVPTIASSTIKDRPQRQSPEVAIRIGPITSAEFVSGSYPKSPDLVDFESKMAAAGFDGGLTAVPYGAASGSGPRIVRGSDGINVAYSTCQLPAVRQDGAAIWQPEVVEVRWTATTRRGTTGSGSVKHFADVQVASMWAQYANALANDPVKLEVLDSVDPASGQQGLAFFLAQHDYVFDCFHSIAQFFNSLNIPWYTHPQSRDLYRKWMAGRLSGGDSVLFNQRSDYNEDHWFTKTHWTDERNPLRLRPLLKSPVADDRYGIIPRLARDAWNRFGSKPGENERFPIDFKIRAGIGLNKLDGNWRVDDADPPIDYQDNVINEAFVIPFALDFNAIIQTGRKNVASLPESEIVRRLLKFKNYVPAIDVDSGGVVGGSTGFRVGKISDWRTYAWDDRVHFAVVPWQVATPLRVYLEWAAEWARMLASTTPETVLTDSRVSVVRTNWQWTEALGPDGFNRAAATSETRADREGRGSDVLTAVSALTDAASGTIPVVGNIIGGVVSGGLSLINQFVRSGSPRSTARDDLGRWKPRFERAYLGGDPLSTVAADGVPLHRVPTLPGFCRQRAVIPPSTLRPEDEERPPVGGSNLNVRSQESEISTGAKVAIGVGVVAVLSAGGYALYLHRKKGRRS